MVFERDGSYHRIPDAEVEDWEELLDAIEGEPQLIEPIEGWSPYTQAYRLPDGSVYLVAAGTED
ncbi:MAG: hypothetical protein Q7S58_01290 [Candidatus Binatus sp.]|uniref:hypothetical protein n=1 Tax=Candidatus Binatus sp. TaxID=2811406 RepID=UPI0027234188|nr:hypothetical protein [Candidatus Binatus sp.]MDO8431023.1 hypothetical protein [Candidatus Binatus sp.]